MTPLDADRVESIKYLLTESTTGYGEPATNREVWDKLARSEANKSIIANAEKVMNEPQSEWVDSVFAHYTNYGMRKPADNMMKARYRNLTELVMAECLEYEGRFIPAIERIMTGLCEQPTWVLVAHDNDLDCFNRRLYHVDLGAAGMSDTLAQIMFLLKDSLSPEIKELLMEKLYERTYQPILNMLHTLDFKTTRQSWITRNNNWNLVCVAGVTNAVLATVEDVALRAEFVAAAEKYIQYGINGFLEDGYCPEGIGYYNYGFEYLIRLREGLYRATEGAIDLFDNPRMAKVATFGQRSEIINGVYPAITDCREGVTPSTWIQWYCNSAFGWEAPEINKSLSGGFATSLISNFANSPCQNSDDEGVESIGIRSYFDKADVLTCRPYAKDWDKALGVAIKGGTNDESHNHNDVGSYTIAAGDELMMGDMGGPTAYNSETFSSVRYTKYLMFSSYGHPLPTFDGVQQYESSKAVGEVLSNSFSDKKDVIKYNILSTYPYEKLTLATREFTYERSKKGRFSVKDSFEAKSPVAFETAITTRQNYEIKGKKLYLIGQRGNKIEVTVKASAPYSFAEKTIESYAINPYSRIAIVFDEPVAKGDVTITYTLVK